MEFNQFVDEVKGRIKQFLPIEYEDAQVRIEEIKKLNENYLGITVLKENQVIAPTFNLNQLYEMFQSDPQNSMENILRNITELVLDAPEQFDPKSITEYETAKDKLFIRVSSAEKNEEMLQNVPHQMREDLAITYHLAISIDDIGVGSTTITNDILKRYGISEEQLHADAMENSPNVRPVQVMIMGSMIEQLMGMGPETIMRDEPVQNIAEIISKGMGMEREVPMFIITNPQTVDGAGVIFYPEVMDQIGEGFQGNFFILPSSTHETLVIPDNGAFDYQVLEDMVQTINENEVAPEERLSDHVYHYDVKDRVFERADKFEERQKEKAAQLDKNEHTGKEQKMEHPKPKKHEKIPAERMNGLKSVGFNLQEGSDYDGMMDLMVAGRSQREILDSIPFYKENKLVQEALKRVEQYIEEKSLNVEKTRPKEEKGEIQKTKSQKRREDMSL